tara:strand:+ start:6681 stop:7412 length:732 start_codon:yes stop_codon:yes gene_type:complete
MTTEIQTQTLQLNQIRIDGGTQPRVAIDEQVVADYAELYGSGFNLPPVTVFFDGANYWLADGFHRYWANKKIDCEYVFADIRQGTQRDAILYSVGANAKHGLRRTSADKRKSVLIMLEDEEWSQWSNREIAKQCGLSDKTVGATRKSLSAEIPQIDSKPKTVKYKRGGKTHKQKNSRKSTAHRSKSHNPIRQSRPALAQTNLNLPHDPAFGARAIVSAMGTDYAQQLIESLNQYLQEQKEGAA